MNILAKNALYVGVVLKEGVVKDPFTPPHPFLVCFLRYWSII